MDDYKHLCPVCKTKGITTFLQLRQINFTTATYLCKDKKCTYPRGHSWIYVDRDIFNEDESDSDSSNISDEVNADIERMLLKFQSSNEINDSEYDNIISDSGIEDPDGQNSCQQSSPTERSCEDVIFVDSVTEVDNVIIDDPDELFCTLDLPSSLSTTNLQPKVLASGDSDSNIVDVTILKDTIHAPANIQYNLLKNDNEPYKFTLDIGMIHQNNDVTNLNTTKIGTFAAGEQNNLETNVKSNKFKRNISIKDWNVAELNAAKSVHTNDIEIIAQNKDVTKLNISKTDKSDAEKQYVIKSNEEPNLFQLDIEMKNQNVAEINDSISGKGEDLVRDGKDSNKLDIKDQKEINYSRSSPCKEKEIKASPKKSICILDVNTGKVSTLTRIETKDVKLNKTKNIDNLNIIKVPFDLQQVINVSKSTSSRQNIISGSENINDKMSQTKSINIDLEKIMPVSSASKNINLAEDVISEMKDLSGTEKATDKMSITNSTNVDIEIVPINKVIEVSKSINSGEDITSKIKDLSDSEEKNERNTSIKHINKDLENILKEINPKDNTVETDSKNLDESSTKVTGRLGRRNNSLDLILPFSEDNPVSEYNLPKSKLETVFRSKLKLHAKKPKESSFYFSESIIEEALKTTKDVKKTETPKNRSLVNLLFESNNSGKIERKSAASFKGFKFSSKTVKSANSAVSKKKNIKEYPSQKQKSNSKKILDSKVIQSKPQTEVVNNDTNVGGSSKSENKNNVSLGLGDLTLNELLDDMSDLGAANVSNNALDISEVDDWLTSLIQ